VRKGKLEIFTALLLIVFCIFMISMTVYGLYLAFSASVLLGIVALVVEPSPFVFGVAMFFWDKNIPEQIVNWLGVG
jgi:uncharacterized membrane protein YvlD (DUF360 family)